MDRRHVWHLIADLAPKDYSIRSKSGAKACSTHWAPGTSELRIGLLLRSRGRCEISRSSRSVDPSSVASLTASIIAWLIGVLVRSWV